MKLDLIYLIVYLAFCCSETLNTKMNWLKNYERIIAIEQQLIWQPVTELDPRAYVPEVLYKRH